MNLALNDSRTMDSLSKMSESARESSTLNRSCFYGADVVDTAQLCEAGLYGKIDSLVARSDAPKDSSGKFIYNGTNDKGDSIYNDTLQSYGSFKRQNYAVFQNSPLKFSSSSDWSSVGMKMDRWKRWMVSPGWRSCAEIRPHPSRGALQRSRDYGGQLD